MSTETPTRRASRLYGAARAHEDACPNKKKVAFDNGVTVRTARRWASPAEAAGSPQDSYARYLITARDPWRLLAHNRAIIVQRHLGRLSDRELVDRIHQLLEKDAQDEGADNGAKVRRGVPLGERAAISERDGATDLELAACYREAEARGLSEVDVFGGWS